MIRSSFQTVKKPILLRKNFRAAGEFEGARPASSWIIAIKKVRNGLFDERSEIFREAQASKKFGVFLAKKRSVSE